MIQSWSDFSAIFSIGFCCGMVVGLTALFVRRVRLTFTDTFRRAMFQ